MPPVRRLLKDWWLSPDLALGMFPDWYSVPTCDVPKQMVLTGFPLQKVLTHQVHIDDFQKGFDLMDAGNCGKVVCSWT